MAHSNIPRPVLSGLFIYMSITSLDGNEFFERVKFLMTWERRRWPRKGWAQKVTCNHSCIYTPRNADVLDRCRSVSRRSLP